MGNESYELNKIRNTLDKQFFNKLFKRFEFYDYVHLNSDSSKIGNLANEEKIISIIHIIKMGGLKLLQTKIETLSNSQTIITLLVTLAPYDRVYAMNMYIQLIDNKDPYTISMQPYGLENMKDDNFHLRNKHYQEKIYNKSSLSKNK